MWNSQKQDSCSIRSSSCKASLLDEHLAKLRDSTMGLSRDSDDDDKDVRGSSLCVSTQDSQDTEPYDMMGVMSEMARLVEMHYEQGNREMENLRVRFTAIERKLAAQNAYSFQLFTASTEHLQNWSETAGSTRATQCPRRTETCGPPLKRCTPPRWPGDRPPRCPAPPAACGQLQRQS